MTQHRITLSTLLSSTVFSWIIKGACLVAGLILSVHLFGQKEYPKDFFGSPLDIPLNLSGNFGELRTNHFHAGLDIKTQQVEGKNVLASAAGYVSRIKVSPFGYGYALYITHTNGYTTVYGHLKKYADKIDAYVKQEQYKLQSFSVDLFPDSTLLPVQKGELIALSGNSGGSGGPHLHFEIRETVSEKVLNPLLFGFDIKDKILPTVQGVWFVPMNDSTFVNGAQLPVNCKTKTNKGDCVLLSPSIPTVYGEIGFAVHADDLLDGNTNRCGIYRIDFFVDDKQVYGQRMDRLDFTTNRAMNAHTIYERFKKHRSSIHASYRLPGNPLDIYENLVNDGIVSFKDGKLHNCEYRLVDIEGNKTTVKFQVQALSEPKGTKKNVKTSLAKWNWEKDNKYESKEIKIDMKARTLYDDLELTVGRGDKIANAVSSTYTIASPYEPIHNSFQLSIKVNKIKPEHERKLTVVRWDPDKDKIISEGGKYENGWITANPSYLGYFAVMIDSVKPTITNSDFGADLKGRTQFSLKISDGLSGIDQIIPKIDGKWALMEYDAKNSKITYYLDPRFITKGSHTFDLTVVDGVGNEEKYTGNFEW